MKATDPITLEQIIPEHPTPEAVRHPTGEALDGILRGPLGRPVMRLWEGLDALVQDGSLLGVELDPTHADNPCFLLDVAPEAPRFYVELFVNEPFFDELYEGGAEDVPLNVLMNWVGADTEPAFWQTALDSSELDFGEVLGRLLSVIQDACPTNDGGKPGQ